MVLLDTSVVLDVLQDDPVWATWSIAQMRAHAQLHELVVNPVIYAELSAAFSHMEALDEVLAQLQLTLQPIPKLHCFWLARPLWPIVGAAAPAPKYCPTFPLAPTRRCSAGRC